MFHVLYALLHEISTSNILSLDKPSSSFLALSVSCEREFSKPAFLVTCLKVPTAAFLVQGPFLRNDICLLLFYD